jgi:DNA-binding PadR family transcriptional regulator
VRRERGLKPRFYYILLALAGGDRHGLAIAREVASLSDDHVRLWPATLYGSLDELCGVGWIEELSQPGRRPADESGKHRIFRLTASGRRALSAETERLSDLLRVAQRRLNAKTGPAS